MRLVIVICATALLPIPSLFAADASLEERVADLERKLKLLGVETPDATPGLDERVALLEERVEQMLRDRGVVEHVEAHPAEPGPVAEVLGVAEPADHREDNERPHYLGSAEDMVEHVTIEGDHEESEESEIGEVLSGYAEMHYNNTDGEPSELDFHRFVVNIGHRFSRNIRFWSQLELEHTVTSGEREESGDIGLAQAYMDFILNPHLTFRSGIMLTPVGMINERHEPATFNGVERPLVETFIIPSSWSDAGFGLTGQFGNGIRYRTFLMGGLNAEHFEADQGIREGRQFGFRSNFNQPARVGRIEYLGTPGLALGMSLYSGGAGFHLPELNPRVDIFEFDGRYGYKRFDFRGLYANVWISAAGELNEEIEHETGHNPNVASQLRGFYMEPAVHLLPRQKHQDVIFFTRYENYDTQRVMPHGFSAHPEYDRDAWFIGLTYKPTQDIAFKVDYVFRNSQSVTHEDRNGFNAGLGWWF